MEMSNALRAEVLVHALPLIQKYNKKTVVIKYGGSAMVNETLKDAVMEDICLLRQVGMNVVLVHGGGPEIKAVLQTGYTQERRRLQFFKHLGTSAESFCRYTAFIQACASKPPLFHKRHVSPFAGSIQGSLIPPGTCTYYNCLHRPIFYISTQDA